MPIQATNITYRHSPRFGLEEISLHLERGKLTALIGPNGSGKTTLIRLLCGFLKPQLGEITLLGRPLHEWPSYDRARHITYVSQTWRPTFPFTVEQAVLMGRTPWRGKYGGFESGEDVKAADRAIELLDLETFRHEPITHLSGGELQRVMIATALAQGTEIILLDEPTTHLDISWQQSILEKLRGVISDSSLTILASIHDLNLASIYSDRIAMLSDGHMVAYGKPADVLTADRLRSVFSLDLDLDESRYGDAPGINYRSPHKSWSHAR